MEKLTEKFIERFIFNSVNILTPDIVREVYDRCTKLTNLMINNPFGILQSTLSDMSNFFKLPLNIQLEKERIDIALCDQYGNFGISIEVENNSGEGARDDTIFSTEVPKLTRYPNKMMVLLTYDYNENDRKFDLNKGRWRGQFVKRLEKHLNSNPVKSPFLFIVGNTPKYAGNLHLYNDSDCIVNWAFWIKYPQKDGSWYQS